MTTVTKDCGVCKEEFNEDGRCPRILSCFHTLCTFCLDQLIRHNTKRCPYCRRVFSGNSASDFMINHTMLELMRYISGHVSDETVPPHKKRITDIMKETKRTSMCHRVNCQETQKQIEKSIKAVHRLQKSLKDENTTIENDVLPVIHNVMSQNNWDTEALYKTSKNLVLRLQEIKSKNRQLIDITGKLDRCTPDTSRNTASLLEEVDETNNAIGEWLEDLKKGISDEERTIRRTEKKVKRTQKKIKMILEALDLWAERDEDNDTITGRITMAFQDDDLPVHTVIARSNSLQDSDEEVFTFTSITDSNIQRDNLPEQIMPESLREMNATLKILLEQGRIFAVQQEDGRRRSARISITDDDRLCLHHLTEQPLPPNVLVVEHSDLIRMVDPSTRVTFLELGVNGSTLGKVFISLTPDTKRARNYSLLCTGEMGPSYANRSMLQVWDKGSEWERVRCSEFEDNSSEGMTLVPGLWEDIGGDYRRPWLAGTVGGEWWGLEDAMAPQFYINTKDNPEEVCDLAFGIVEDGLQVLNEAISHLPNPDGICIHDCGIVLPC